MSTTLRVLMAERCNQGCSFCTARRSQESAAVFGKAAAHIEDALLASPKEIVLTGGEPTMRGDLDSLVRAASAGGVRVVLETNAALITEARARSLAAAGLSVARVHFPAWGDACDAVTRDPGGFVAAERGVRALQAAGVEVEASVPLVASNRAHLPMLAGKLAELVERVLLVPVLQSPDKSELLSAAELAQALADFRAHCGTLSLKLSPSSFVPPCIFPQPARFASLYALTPGGAERSGMERQEACSPCRLRERCPGVPAPLDFQARPIKSENVRRRLSMIDDVRTQTERELAQDDVFRDDQGVAHAAKIIRVHFACNQRCDFCFVSTHLPEVAPSAIEALIDEAAAEGRIIVLSGGEPTLSPYLLDFVRRAQAGGAPHIDLQTNATNIDDSFARKLAGAGVDWAFVSLHAPNASLSDGITGAPGTFDKTVVGMRALGDAGVLLRLNYVLHGENAAAFPEHVDWVHENFPEAILVPSFVAASTDLVPRALVPRYADVLPHLAEGLRRAGRHGLRVLGLDSLCGVPLCLIPATYAEDLTALAEAPADLSGGEMRYPPPCEGCHARDRCFGLRRTYLELHGHDELRPFTA
ncbi:MAG: radical SAM protein [Polyangiales bacterium]